VGRVGEGKGRKGEDGIQTRHLQLNKKTTDSTQSMSELKSAIQFILNIEIHASF
jgi:hypothetical protein